MMTPRMELAPILMLREEFRDPHSVPEAAYTEHSVSGESEHAELARGCPYVVVDGFEV